MRTGIHRKRIVGGLTTACLILVLALGVLIAAGCQSEQQAKQKQYKEQWTKIMDQFQARVAKDDKTAQDLLAKNDLPSLIKLLKQRVASTDTTLGEILALFPPPELRKLQGTTAYYLVSLIDRLQAQSDLSVAVLSNTSTKDLQDKLNNLGARNQTIGNELAVELAKDGITLHTPAQEVPGSTPTSAPTSVPASTPGK